MCFNWLDATSAPSDLQQLGIALTEELLQGGGIALLEGMDTLDQAKDVGSHDQKVAKAPGAGVPVGVWGAARDEDGGAGASFDFVIAGLHAECSFEDVPGFVIIAVDVTRSDQTRRAWGPTRILPLGDDEGIIWRT